MRVWQRIAALAPRRLRSNEASALRHVMPRTRLLLLLLASTYAVAGLLDPFLAPNDRTATLASVALGVVVMILCYLWCKADAAERGMAHIGGTALAAFIPPIGLPIYFFRTRPVRRALVSIGKSLLFLLAVMAIYVLAAFVVELVRGAGA